MNTTINEFQEQYGDRPVKLIIQEFPTWYDDHDPGTLLELRPTTRANYVCDRMWSLAAERLAGRVDVKFQKKGQARFIDYRQRLLVKIKKINSRTRTANIRTGAVYRFNNGLPVFPGFDDRIPCVLGYRLDALAEKVEFVALVRPDIVGKNRVSVLYDAAASDGRNLEFPFARPVAGNLSVAAKRIRPKRSSDVNEASAE